MVIKINKQAKCPKELRHENRDLYIPQTIFVKYGVAADTCNFIIEGRADDQLVTRDPPAITTSGRNMGQEIM